MLDLGPVLVTLVVWVLGLAVLYWVIRLAVGHAIQDADRRRDQPTYPASPPPTPPAGGKSRPPAAD